MNKRVRQEKKKKKKKLSLPNTKQGWKALKSAEEGACEIWLRLQTEDFRPMDWRFYLRDQCHISIYLTVCSKARTGGQFSMCSKPCVHILSSCIWDIKACTLIHLNQYFLTEKCSMFCSVCKMYIFTLWQGFNWHNKDEKSNVWALNST